MVLQLPDRWIWDFWFAADGDDVHVFYLQAPRSLRDPGRRHRNATVGHAVSTDLRSWTVLPDALTRGAPGAFDDLATWTGSVLRHDGRWLMFYTGVSTVDDGMVQRIGVAESSDLQRWTRQRQALLGADGRWYEKPGPAREEAWRDPWVFRDAATGTFHLLITARVPVGPLDGRGVIGHATSTDSLNWQVRAPLSEPGEFTSLEVPQLLRVGEGWWILFSAQSYDASAARLTRPGVRAEGGTHYLRGADRLGPYALGHEPFLVGDPAGRYYAGRMLCRHGRRVFLAWQQFDEHGEFLGALSDPMPVREQDGRLSVAVLR